MQSFLVIHRLRKTPRPIPAITIWSTGNFFYRCLGVVKDKGAVTRKSGGVFFRRHMTATTPVFVADTPIIYAKGFLSSISSSFVGQGRIPLKVRVFDPVAQFGGAARTQITGKIRFSP